MQSGVISLKAQRSKEHAIRLFQTSKQGFLFPCVCALAHICAFMYKTFPTSVQGSNLFKN